jgi:hypothetical protein
LYIGKTTQKLGVTAIIEPDELHHMRPRGASGDTVGRATTNPTRPDIGTR